VGGQVAAQNEATTELYIDAGNGKILAMEQQDGNQRNDHEDEEQEGERG
jgi:hypothetical protein